MILPQWNELTDTQQGFLLSLASTYGPVDTAPLDAASAKAIAIEMYTASRHIIEHLNKKAAS